MTKALLLGYSEGVSKKSGKPFYVVHMGIPFEKFGTGLMAYSFFVDSTIYQHAIAHKVVEYVNADIRYSNGSYFLVDVE